MLFTLTKEMKNKTIITLINKKLSPRVARAWEDPQHHASVENTRLVEGLADRGQTWLLLSLASSCHNKQLFILHLLAQQADEKKL